MPRPVHFDLCADDPERAVTFYTDVFGWKFQKWDGPQEYWLISTGETQPGIDGGMGRRGPQSGPAMNTIDVPSADDFSRRITAAGGKVVMPKVAIPGVGWLAVAVDTEGNTFGIMESDSQAA